MDSAALFWLRALTDVLETLNLLTLPFQFVLLLLKVMDLLDTTPDRFLCAGWTYLSLRIGKSSHLLLQLERER